MTELNFKVFCQHSKHRTSFLVVGNSTSFVVVEIVIGMHHWYLFFTVNSIWILTEKIKNSWYMMYSSQSDGSDRLCAIDNHKYCIVKRMSIEIELWKNSSLSNSFCRCSGQNHIIKRMYCDCVVGVLDQWQMSLTIACWQICTNCTIEFVFAMKFLLIVTFLAVNR